MNFNMKIRKLRRSLWPILKFGFLFFVFIILTIGIYLIYVPYDFTIASLASVYDRCWLKQFDSYSIENCHDSKGSLVNITARSPWVSVSERRLIVYSSYLMEKNVVKVLALKHVDECRPVLCYFQINESDHRSTVNNSNEIVDKTNTLTIWPTSMGVYDLIRLDCWWDCEYLESFFINCPIPSSAYDYSTSIVSVRLIPIDYAPCKLSLPNSIHLWPSITTKSIPNSSKTHNLTMCISPIFDWIDVAKISLFIEYYLRQGATRFVIYRRSWTKDVERILDYYMNRREIELDILDWPLLPEILGEHEEINLLNKHVSYNGQVLAMNDCGLRERGRSRFVAHVDLDEFITSYSTKHDRRNLLNLLYELDEPSIGSFVFEHVRVYSSLAPLKEISFTGDDRNWLLNISDAVMIRSPNGRVDHFPSRTKSIVKPETILRQGVHFVWTHEPGYKKIIVPNERALFYHLSALNTLNDEQLRDLFARQTVRDWQDTERLRELFAEVQDNVNAAINAM